MFEKLVAYLESCLGTAYADATTALVTDAELAQCIHIEYEQHLSIAEIVKTACYAQALYPMYFIECKGRFIDVLPRCGYVLD